MDVREADEVLRAGLRLSSIVAQLQHADDNLNQAAAVCLGDVAVPAKLAADVAQAQVRVQETIVELREVRRLLRNVALSEARAARARMRGSNPEGLGGKPSE
jgi:hypothetical protein